MTPQTDKNKVVHKLLDMGCWHEESEANKGLMYCGKTYRHECHSKNPDYTTWAGFGPAWEKAQTMPWWGEFWDFVYEMAEGLYKGRKGMPASYFWTTWLTGIYPCENCVVNPTHFRDLLYKFAVETGRDK